MIYNRPRNVTNTQMCIYIDNHIYTDDYNVDLVFQYLYFLSLSLSYQMKLFVNRKYYDDFAIYVATRVYLRLTSKKQYEYKENGEPRLKPIKSVLNYLKSVLYPLRLDFEKSDYYQAVPYIEETERYIDYNVNNLIYNSLNEILKCDFRLYLNEMGSICEEVLQHTPYKKGTPEYLNVYTSIILTLLKQLTISEKNRKHLQYLHNKVRIDTPDIQRAYREVPENVVLFHLTEKYKNCILLLVREVKTHLTSEMKEFIDMYTYSEDELREVVRLSFFGDIEGEDNYDDN